MRATKLSKVLLVWSVGLMLASTGCKKPKTPNTTQPEDKLLFDFAQTLTISDKQGALAFYDLEAKQKLDFWDKTLRPIKDHAKQAEAFTAGLPRIGDKVALFTVGDDAWKEVKDSAWAQELADGLCISGAPSVTDFGKGVDPKGIKMKEAADVPQELGLWVFELHTMIDWMPSFRVHCPTKGEFWIQLSRRKKDPTQTDDNPLKIFRIVK